MSSRVDELGMCVCLGVLSVGVRRAWVPLCVRQRVGDRCFVALVCGRWGLHLM